MAQTLNYTIGADRRTFVKDIQNFKIDFADDNNNWVQARQFERGMRQVFVNILNEDHTPFDMTGCNVWFEGLLPENSKGDFRVIDATGFVPIDLQNGQFRFDLPGHAFTVAGSYRQAFFRIVKNGNSVTTLEFDLQVLADKVIGGLVPKDWIGPFEEIADKLVDDLDKHTDAADKVIADFQQKVTDLINQLNRQGSTTTSMLTELQNRINDLETKIKQDGLFTQVEAETFKQVIEQELDKLRSNAVTVFDTETDLMQANLNSGLTVRTLGCTAVSDGLGAIYKIVNEQPASGYSIKLANGKYAMLVSIDAFRKAHMVYQAGQVGELSDQRSLKTTNLVTNHGITAFRNTKGSGQDATVASIIANTQDPTSAVLGVDTPRIFAYKNLDSVALYIANGTDNPHITIQKGTYATTKNEFILNEDIEGIEPGMYIAFSSVETTHSKLNFSDIAYLAQILTVSGRTLTVDGYYSKDSEEPLDAGPSPSTYTAYINPITKRWGINPAVEIGADDRPSGAVIEGDVKNHNVSDDPDDLGVFDAANLKDGKANYAFRAHTNSYSNPFDNGVDLTNTLNLLKGYGTPQSFQKIITAERTDKDIPFIMDYDGAVSYEALIPTKEQQANWASFQIQDAGASYTLKNVHNGQYLTLAIGTAGDFSLLVDEQNVQSIDYNDANTPRHGLKMTFQRANGGYMLFRIFVYQNRAYIMSMVNGKFISAEGS